MIEHEKYELLCSSALDGTLTEEERTLLDTHLEQCPDCAALMQDLTAMRQMLKNDAIPMPQDLHETIMAGVQAQAEQTVVRPEKPHRRMPVFTMVAAAAVVMMVVLSGGVGNFFNTQNGMSASSSADAAATQYAMDAGSAEASFDTKSAPEQTTESTMTNDTMSTADSAAEAAAPAMQSGAKAVDPPAEYSAELTDAMTVPTTPPSLADYAVAYVYLATGGTELPPLSDGVVLEATDGFRYIELPNNMSIIEQTLTSLEDAGYSVTEYFDSGLATNDQAQNWLLIVAE